MRILASMLFGRITTDEHRRLCHELADHVANGTLHTLFDKPAPPVGAVAPPEYFDIEIVDSTLPSGITMRLIVGLSTTTPFTIEGIQLAASRVLSGQLFDRWVPTLNKHTLTTDPSAHWETIQARLYFSDPQLQWRPSPPTTDGSP
jgi:hypothetical protein